MSENIKTLANNLAIVHNIRNLLTEFVELAIKCSDSIDEVIEGRQIPQEVVESANFFMLSSDDIARMIHHNVFGQYANLTNIFNEQGYKHRGRFTFPIKDINGRAMALASWNRQKSHKYLTSRCYGFKESCYFYGMDQFKNALQKGFVIVVEGYFDKLRWNQAGFDNVFAVMSNELSPYKRMVLNRIPKTIFVPDNDSYGRANSHMSNEVNFKDSFRWYTNREFVRLELPDKFNGHTIKDSDDMSVALKNDLYVFRQWVEMGLKSENKKVIKLTV